MKNKILDNLPTIFLCLVFLFGMTLTWNHAKASEDPDTKEDRIENLPGIWWEQVPAVCVPNTTLIEFTERKGFQPLNRSYGRNRGQSKGEVVYIITYWLNVKENQVMSSVMVPNATYSCVLYRTFDLQVNPDFEFELGIKT